MTRSFPSTIVIFKVETEIKRNEKPSLCSSCGNCCKTFPGIVHPSELGEVTAETLMKAFDEGFQIDYWEGNLTGNPEHEEVTFYYLRPQTKKSKGKLLDASWGGECLFLTPSGCGRSFEKRPLQCRALKPMSNNNCYYKKEHSKVEMIKEWIPHNKVFKEVLEKFYDS